jgi:hypothetical protein
VHTIIRKLYIGIVRVFYSFVMIGAFVVHVHYILASLLSET